MYNHGCLNIGRDTRQMLKVKLFTLSSFLLFFLFYSAQAFAAADDPGSFGSVTSNVNTFQANIAILVGNILADPELSNVVDMLFKGFAAVVIINLFVGWQFGPGVAMGDILGTILLIMMVRVIMVGYNDLTAALWGVSEGFAQGIQRVAIGNTDIFFIPRFVNDIFDSISFGSIAWYDGIQAVIGLLVISATGIFMVVLTVLASSWALWGYALSKIIGWLFVPMILFDRLSFMFDGWLRLFIGFLIYNIIARVNLVLTAVLLQSFFNLPSPALGTGDKFLFTINHWSDIFALTALLVIAILGLISTGSFAKEVAGGVGGMGSSVRGMAFGLGRMAGR